MTMGFTESTGLTISRAFARSPRSIILGTGGLLVIRGDFFPNRDFGFYVILVGAIVLLLGISFEFYVYLQESRRRFLRDRAYYERQSARAPVGDTDNPLREMSAELSRLKTLHPDVEVTHIAALRERISAEQHLNSIRQIANNTQKRLSEEVNALGSRANLQLAFGIMISMAGLSVLGYFVFTIPGDLFIKGKELEFAGYFITRLSLVGFIEIFAYFFLRLYRIVFLKSSIFKMR
jgi:hypothetical protein